MVLIDTNIPLELLCDQENASDVRSFFQVVGLEEVHMTDFSLYSIGIFLFKVGKPEIFNEFIEDMIEKGAMNIVRLPPEECSDLVGVSQDFNLDYDDAYQYAVAEKRGLTLISFDSDFKQVPIEVRTPSEFMSAN